MSHTQTSSAVQEFNVLVACESRWQMEGAWASGNMTAGRSQSSSEPSTKGCSILGQLFCAQFIIWTWQNWQPLEFHFLYLSGWLRLNFKAAFSLRTGWSNPGGGDCSLRLRFSRPWLGHLRANRNFTVFVWKAFSGLLFALEHTMSSSWLPRCKSFKGHLFFFFNDNVTKLKEPRMRNQEKKKR